MPEGVGVVDHRQVGPQRSRDRLQLGDAVGVEDGLGNPLEQDHVGRIPKVVVGLDHQQFGVQASLREVALGRGAADVGRRGGRDVGAPVVTCRCNAGAEVSAAGLQRSARWLPPVVVRNTARGSRICGCI